MGVEPMTSSLPRTRSTTELQQQDLSVDQPPDTLELDELARTVHQNRIQHSTGPLTVVKTKNPWSARADRQYALVGGERSERYRKYGTRTDR